MGRQRGPVGHLNAIHGGRLIGPLLAGLVAVGCVSDDAVTRGVRPSVEPSISSDAPEGTEAEDKRVIRRVLDFEGPARTGDLVALLPYGEAESELGFAPRCVDQDCDLPCPCTESLVPVSFDIDRGEIWILDGVKGRVAKYGFESNFLAQVTASDFGLRATDIQVSSEGNGVVLSQAGDFSAHFTTTDPVVNTSTGSEGYSTFTLDGERIFFTIFEQEGLSEVETPVEVVLDGRKAKLVEVPGIPFLDGWAEFEPYAGDRSIPLTATSSDFKWSEEIRLRMRTSRGHSASGHVAWERGIAPDGTMHFLVFAGTYGKKRLDDWWYMRVLSDGTVGIPVRLRRASETGGPYRHLSLDGAGRPYAMWAHREKVIIEDLSDL